MSSKCSGNDDREPKLDEKRNAGEPNKAALEFCRLIGRLKTTPRTGWVRRNVPGYESVADHSWRVAVMAGLLFDEEHKTTSSSHSDLVLMALVHDLAECIVGDICPEDQVTDKHEREAKAMEEIVQLLRKAGGSHERLAAAFEDYEARRSPESQLVKDLDGLDMILQASEYEERYGMGNLDDFFQNRKFYNEKVKSLVDSALDERATRNTQRSDVRTEGSGVLSMSDQAFIEEYSRASPLSDDAIYQVVLALRHWEKK